MVLLGLLAELAFWTTRKTLSYSWRGMWWGVQRLRGNVDSSRTPPPLRETTSMDVSDSSDLKQLVDQVEELRQRVQHQEEEIEQLQKHE